MMASVEAGLLLSCIVVLLSLPLLLVVVLVWHSRAYNKIRTNDNKEVQIKSQLELTAKWKRPQNYNHNDVRRGRKATWERCQWGCEGMRERGCCQQIEAADKQRQLVLFEGVVARLGHNYGGTARAGAGTESGATVFASLSTCLPLSITYIVANVVWQLIWQSKQSTRLAFSFDSPSRAKLIFIFNLS